MQEKGENICAMRLCGFEAFSKTLLVLMAVHGSFYNCSSAEANRAAKSTHTLVVNHSEDEKQLFLAAKAGNRDILKKLIVKGISLDVRNENGETPMYVAINHGFEAFANDLLDAKADPKISDLRGYTTLYQAAAQGYVVLCRRLVNTGLDVNALGDGHVSVLFIAANQGKAAVVSYLIQAGARINHADSNGSTALRIASKKGHTKVVKVLLTAGISAPEDGRTVDRVAFFYGICGGYVEIVQNFLDIGADPNSVVPLSDESIAGAGDNTLLAASSCHSTPVASLLLKNGAAPNYINPRTRYTPLYVAASFGDLDLVKTLIDAGAKVNFDSTSIPSPIHIAASTNEEPRVLSYLVTKGANVNLIDDRGRTPLHQVKTSKAADLLLKAGADPNAVSRVHEEITPLHQAALDSNSAVAERLIASGARPNTRAGYFWNGATPLHFAILVGNKRMVRALLAANAPLDIRCDKNENAYPKGQRAAGTTPLELAEALRENKIAELIKAKTNH
jgi:uncharacterized protein